MAGPRGAKRSGAEKNVDKDNEDTARSLSSWKSLSCEILQLKCNEHSLVATGANKLLAKRLFDFFKSKRDETELEKIATPRRKSKRPDTDPSSVLSETTDITLADPGTSQHSSKPPSVEELAAGVRNLTHNFMDLTDKQKRSKQRKHSPSISTLSLYSTLYLNENTIDIIALNETFLNKKVNFKIQGYNTIRNDHSTGLGGGVAFLVKHALVVNKEFRNADFNIITDNEALAINLELSSNQNLTLATIYCPDGNPNFPLFQTINNFSDNVMFVGDFNSKLEAFGCASKNTSGPKLKTIQNKLNLTYVNNDEHTHMDRRTGSTDILDMAFISQNLAIHDLQFQIGVNLGSDHLPIEISTDTTPHRNTFTNHTRYKFDQTDREVLESILEEVLGSEDFSGHLSTSDLGMLTLS